MNTAKINQIMTTQVETVHPDDVMSKVSELFKQNNFHHIPVVDSDNKVCGMVSKSDYQLLQTTFTFFKTQRSEEYNKSVFRSLLVREVMTSNVVSLYPEDDVQKAATIFRKNKFHAVPIIDRDKKLVGILSTYDLINFAYPVAQKTKEVAI